MRDDRAEREHRHIGLEQHADVVVLLSEAKADIEKHLDLKLDSLKWRMIAALLGGQVVAGAVAAVITKTSPAQAGQVALDLLANLY
jgi:hypothetical protein